MPNKKSIKPSAPGPSASQIKAINQGLKPINLLASGDMTRRLTAKETKAAQELVKLTSSLLDQNKLTSDLKARTLCAFWVSSFSLFFDAYLAHIKNKNFMAVEASIAIFKSRYDEMFAFITGYLSDPLDSATTPETKRLIHRYVPHYMGYFCHVHVHFGLAISIQNESQKEEMKHCLQKAVSSFDKLEALFNGVTPTLLKYEKSHLSLRRDQAYLSNASLIVQLKRVRTVNETLIKMLRDSLYPPENANESFANSIAPAIAAIRADPIMAKAVGGIEKYSMNRPFTSSMVASSSSSSQDEEDSLLLDNSLNNDIINHELQKIIHCIINPDFNQKTLETNRVHDWLQDPQRLSRVPDNIDKFIHQAWPLYKKEQPSLTTGFIKDFDKLKKILDEQVQISQIVTYFLHQVGYSERIANRLILRLLDIHNAFITLSKALADCKIPNGQLSWCKATLNLLGMAFDRSYPALLLFLNHPAAADNQDLVNKLTSTALNLFCDRITNCLAANAIEQGLALYHQAQSLKPNDLLLQARLDKLFQTLTTPLPTLFGLEQRLQSLAPAIDEHLAKTASISIATDASGGAIFTQLEALHLKLKSGFAEGQSLSALGLLLEDELEPILDACFDHDTGRNLLHARVLQAIFSLCQQASNWEETLPVGFGTAFKWYSSAITKASLTWAQQTARSEQQLIQQSLQALNEGKIPDVLSNGLNRYTFLFELHRHLGALQAKNKIHGLAVIAELTADKPIARFLHEHTLTKLFKMMSETVEQDSFESATLAFINWSSCENAFIHFIERMNDIPKIPQNASFGLLLFSSEPRSKIRNSAGYYSSLNVTQIKKSSRPKSRILRNLGYTPEIVSHLLQETIRLRLEEARLYFVHGYPEIAQAKAESTVVVLNDLAGRFGTELFESVRIELSQMQAQFENRCTGSWILSLLRNPFELQIQEGELLPLEAGSTKHEQENLGRLQRALWRFNDQAAPGFDASQAREIFRAWFLHFRALPIHPVTRKNIQEQWITGYRIWRRCWLPVMETVQQPSPEKPAAASSEKVKINWQEYAEERRLKAIALHNEQRAKTLASRKEHKQWLLAQQQLVAGSSEACESGSSQVDDGFNLAEEIPDQIEYEQKPAEAEPISETLMLENPFSEAAPVRKEPARKYASWVDSVRGKIMLDTEFPPLASSSTEPVLPDAYQHPQSLQTILDALTSAGYLALAGGGYTRDLLRGIKPNDIDIFTNCPPDELQRFIKDVERSDNFPSLFFVKVLPGETRIDLMCMQADTALDIALQFDFSVNCFFITHDGKLVIPFAQAIEDLANKTLRAVIPLEQSFEEDISRLWRMIRLANQLEWALDEESKQTIRMFAPKLCQMNIHQFLAHFKKCFVRNESIAIQNFKSFEELGLLPWLLATANGPASLSKDGLAFCMNELNKVFAKNISPQQQLTNVLALVNLMRRAISLPARQIAMQDWLSTFEEKAHNPRVMQHLKTGLPVQLRHYYQKMILASFNPEAKAFNPVAGLWQPGFWSAPECSRDNTEGNAIRLIPSS